MRVFSENATVVLAHGAWADGSCWQNVIRPLQAQGLKVTAATDDRVKGLVFIAALAPDEGETVAQMFYRAAPHPSAPRLEPDANGFIWMPEEGFRSAVAHEASADQTAILAAVQRPIAASCIHSAHRRRRGGPHPRGFSRRNAIA